MVLGKIDQLDAELLLAHALGKSREFILANPDHLITLSLYHFITRLFKKRQEGIPLAYLTGHKEFFGLDFFVNKHVLIPRPDTEVLVEFVLNHIHNSKFINHNSIMIDVGTGSGCIPISILKNLPTCKPEYLQTFATDISHKALRVAKKNAKKHHVKASPCSAHVAGKIKFLHGNLLSPFLKTCKLADLQTCRLIITANLPYITEKQFQQEPSIHHEPKIALVAEDQGLALYEELLEQLANLSTCKLACFFEIDPSQSQKIKSLIKKYLPTAKIEIKQDLAGLDRVVKIGVN